MSEMLMGEKMSVQGSSGNKWRFSGRVLFALLVSLCVTGASAQKMPVRSTLGQNPAQTQSAQAALAAAQNVPPPTAEAAQSLHLLVGRSLVITSPTRIKRVSLADTTIADAIVVSPFQVVLNGKAPGTVSLLLWDESDQNQIFEVTVDIDILSLTQKIHESFPSEPVQLEAARDVVMISGKASSAAVAEKILEVVKGVTPKVTSLLQVPANSPGEILLEVKFAEVNRATLSQLAINILRNFGTNMPLATSTQQFSPFGFTTQSTTTTTNGGNTTQTSQAGNAFTISDLLNIAIFRPDINMAATIQALQTNDVLQILAEPNLMTESGKEASFLAGGEFPYPVIQSTSGGGGATTVPAITIQFKEFGIRLTFTPVITPDGLIHLKVAPEVSALDFANGIKIQGFTLPALSTRRVQSEMELRDGQSFAIAGLIDNRVTETFAKMPGIGDIPILGNFFKSRSLNKSDDELLVLVTPRIVHPLQPGEVPAGPVFPKPFLGPVVPEQPKTPAAK
jgi:pilus assembly protein CpaC